MLATNEAIEAIRSYCLQSQAMNPIEMATNLMSEPSLQVHGDEYHFLVPAVLLTAYFNATDRSNDLPQFLDKAQRRAEAIQANS